MRSTQRIRLKTEADVECMAAAAADLVSVFLALRDGRVKPGVTTGELDGFIEEAILSQGNLPAFKGYPGPIPFPGSACISINDEVVHGVPGGRVIEDGDIVGIDIGLIKDGWHADSAETFLVGAVSPEAEKLCRTTLAALQDGIAAARAGNRVSDIGRAIERHAHQHGFGVVENLVGHGIGRDLHEDPQVPNFECFTLPNPELEVGMVLALEPMFNLGSKAVKVLPDEWTVATVDGAWSAHFEHTVAITESGPRVLTAR